jgi:MFS family permease
MSVSVTLSERVARGQTAGHSTFVAAWFLCLVFYFVQYALRSAPGVMIPELSTAFGLTTLGVSTVVGVYFYTYAAFALVSGATLDRYGAKLPLALGVFAAAIGSILFGLGSLTLAEGGRLLLGAGSAFSFTGAVYLAARAFPAKWLATAVGFTQFAGMLGGFLGTFAVGPLVHGVIGWQSFWVYAGLLTTGLALLVLIMTPGSQQTADANSSARSSLSEMFAPFKTVLSNPQSWLCGMIGGLLFMPTTIGDMIWGVPFLHLGLGVETAEAVSRSAMVPLGWCIGAPLLGYLADRSGERKPVLFAGTLLMLVSGIGVAYFSKYIPPYVGGLLFGIGSGAAMIPYSMIKEANPDNVKGSATGAMNFLVFSLSAFLAPAFGFVLQQLSGGKPLTLHTFQMADLIWVAAIGLSLVLTYFVNETGSAAKLDSLKAR